MFAASMRVISAMTGNPPLLWHVRKTQPKFHSCHANQIRNIVYSKWSCAFLDLRSSECRCARASTCFVSRIIKCGYSFPAITPFSVGCFSGGTCRTDKIKTSIYDFNTLLWSIIAVELTNSSETQNHMVFQSTSEQATYGASDILRNRKTFAVFLWG